MIESPPLTRQQSRWIGAAFWCLVAIALILGISAPGVGTGQSLGEALVGEGRSVEVLDRTGRLRVGDSVFAGTESQPWRQVGHVTDVRTTDVGVTDVGVTDVGVTDVGAPAAAASSFAAKRRPHEVTVQLYDLDAPVERLNFRLHQASGNMNDLLATLLPEEKRERLREKIRVAMREHGRAITQAMLPIVMQSLRNSFPVIEEELQASLQRHRDEVDALLARYRREIVQDRIVPLAQDEILPVLQRHGQEPAEQIGQEIWNRAPLWQLGWRAVYDQSPLPKRDMLQEKWRRFVDEEVIPIVRAHTDEIVEALEKTLTDLAANERLRDEFASVARQIAEDPEARQLARTIITEAILENQRLRDVWVATWTTDEAQQALESAGRRIEPVVRQIGDEVMGTREEGIEPGFARVLRNQILGKDRMWLTVEPRATPRAETQQPVVTWDASFAVYPVVRLARPVTQ